MADDLTSLASRDLMTFDCYGTLIDWRAGLHRSIGQALVAGPSAPTPGFLNHYVTMEAEVEGEPYRPYREVLCETMRRLAKQSAWALRPGWDATFAESLGDWPPFPDTVAALRRLARRFRLGVLSNIDRDLFALTARRLEVKIDLLVTAEDVRSYKPGLGHFRALLNQVPSPDHVVHVAQSQFHDGVPCRDLGLAYVWINRYNDPPLDGVPMVAEFNSLQALADRLDSTS